LLDEFAKRTGRGWLGNKAASGTAIVDELGAEHQRTGKWIVYTSADSVFQIAAHEATVPLAELYRACVVAREILIGEDAVSRVIARPLRAGPGTTGGRPIARFFDRADRNDAARPDGGRRCGARRYRKVDDLFAGGTSAASIRRRTAMRTG